MGPVTIGAVIVTAVCLVIFAGLVLAGILDANGRKPW
jgi:hypothetical protein